MKSLTKRTNYQPLYLSILILFTLFLNSFGSMEFEAYRLIQYTTKEGQHFGSQSQSLNFAAAHYQGNIFRKIALIHFNELFTEAVQQILSKYPMGILIILPNSIDKTYQAAQVKIWEDIQQQLANQYIIVPVFFAYESNELMDLYNKLKSQTAMSSIETPQTGLQKLIGGSGKPEHVMIVNINEPKLLTSLTLDAFYGILNFQEYKDQAREGRIDKSVQTSDSNPIIAISTSYDALAISPELSIAMENSASPVIAEFLMSKMFTKLMQDLNQPNAFKYDLLFILTPSGSFNYEGTGKFIDHLYANIKERIKFVICLDTLVNSSQFSNDLYILHGSLSEKNQISNKFIKELKNAASNSHMKITTKDESYVSQNKKFIQYEHIIYNEKGIPAITISAKDEKQQNRYQKYSVFDTMIKNDDFKRNLIVISEAIARLINELVDTNTSFFADNQQAISDDYLEQLKAFFQKNPRAPHLIQRDSIVSKEIFKMLGNNLQSVKRMGISFKDVQFYEEKLGNKIVVLLVTSKFLELYILFGVLIYLVVLYFGMQKFSKEKVEKAKEE